MPTEGEQNAQNNMVTEEEIRDAAQRETLAAEFGEAHGSQG